MEHYLPTAAEVAVLSIFLGWAYAEEKKTRLTRFRISSRTLRKIARRSHLRDVFLDEWADELDRRGWKVIWDGDNQGLIRRDAIDGWARLSSKRIADNLENMNASTIKRIARKLERS
jgi:hypothetical protein